MKALGGLFNSLGNLFHRHENQVVPSTNDGTERVENVAEKALKHLKTNGNDISFAHLYYVTARNAAETYNMFAIAPTVKDHGSKVEWRDTGIGRTVDAIDIQVDDEKNPKKIVITTSEGVEINMQYVDELIYKGLTKFIEGQPENLNTTEKIQNYYMSTFSKSSTFER